MAIVQSVHLSIFRCHMNENLSQTPTRTSQGKRARAKRSYSSTFRPRNLHHCHYMQMFASLAADDQPPAKGYSSSEAKKNEGGGDDYADKEDNSNSYGKRGKLRRARRGRQRARDFRRLGFWYLTSSMTFILRKAKAFFDGGLAAHECNRANEFVVVDPYFSMPVIPPITASASTPCVV